MATNRRDIPQEAAPAQEGLVDVAILDDDADFLSYMEDFLHDEGQYAVRTFSSPDPLFAEAESRRPDIVLLDMKMGDVRGDGVLEQLLTRFPGLCVIIVTGYPSLEDMRATFKLKVFDYVAKPFSLAQIRQVLANAVETFGLGKALPPHPAASRRARVVAQGPGSRGTPQHQPDQFHRTRRELALDREPAGHRQGL